MTYEGGSKVLAVMNFSVWFGSIIDENTDKICYDLLRMKVHKYMHELFSKSYESLKDTAK